MKGTHKLRISDKYNSYTFELKRNITILRGDSGTGKTTLFDMVNAYYKEGKKSGVRLNCDKKIVPLQNKIWREQLDDIEDSIVIIDEECKDIKTKEFANVIKQTDNYYLLITRLDLDCLPYSIDEIYEIEGNKNKIFVPIYQSKEKIYPNIEKYNPDIIIVEDSNSGFQFFNIIKDNNIECFSSMSKSKILNILHKMNIENRKILVVADGAAFGSEINDIYQFIMKKDVVLFLPESFEWLILKSGVIEKEIKEIKKPENFIESKDYFSWEKFFEDLLCKLTEDYKNKSYKKYSKKKIDKFYLEETNANKILKLLGKISIRNGNISN